MRGLLFGFSFILICIELFVGANALYGPSSPVVQLNPSNFKSKVNYIWVSLFLFFSLCFSLFISVDCDLNLFSLFVFLFFFQFTGFSAYGPKNFRICQNSDI